MSTGPDSSSDRNGFTGVVAAPCPSHAAICCIDGAQRGVGRLFGLVTPQEPKGGGVSEGFGGSAEDIGRAVLVPVCATR